MQSITESNRPNLRESVATFLAAPRRGWRRSELADLLGIPAHEVPLDEVVSIEIAPDDWALPFDEALFSVTMVAGPGVIANALRMCPDAADVLGDEKPVPFASCHLSPHALSRAESRFRQEVERGMWPDDHDFNGWLSKFLNAMAEDSYS